MPTFFYWLWLMIKFRRVSFYKYANPSIINGGFYGDNKFAIYNLLPKNSYPTTILLPADGTHDFKKIMDEHQLYFPLIVKPDIGLRGKDVEKVHSIDEIENYFQLKKQTF